MAGFSPPENQDQKGDKPFWINGLPKQIRSKIRVQKRTGCWLWQGTIRPARARKRPSRYVNRVHDTFEPKYSFEQEAALPEVWDGRKGAKVAAHRFIRSVLTCTPIDEVPSLGRCHDARCVSPWHNMEIGPPTVPPAPLETAVPVPTPLPETGAAVDVLAALKEHRPATGFDETGFPGLEEEYGLPAGSITMPVWVEYAAWDEENPDDDD